MKPDAAAGHSLGEFSALVVAGALSFEDGLKLVSKRALAMQAACEAQPGTMAAILGLDDKTVEDICASIDGVVVAANYNCPGQLVISGAVEAVEAACEKAKAAGARRALRLPVGGAFHSPLMEPAKQELEKAINEAPFQAPVCPVYQNVDAKPYTDPAQIKGEPDRTADGSGTLDLHREEHARRRRDGVHRTRPRHCTSGAYQESKPRSNGRIEIDAIK